MIKIEAYQTSDGKIHATFRAAKEHAENRFGGAITALAHALLRADGKYAKILSVLEENVEAMRTIVALSDDRELIEEDD